MRLNHLIIIGALCGALLIPTSAQTWGVMTFGVGGGGGNLDASDNFNTSDSLAGWTQSSGSWNETGSVLASSTTATNAMIMYSTPSNTTSQVMEFKLTMASYTNRYVDIILRAADATTNADMIIMEWECVEGQIRLYRSASYGGSWTQLGSTVTLQQPVTNHYYGVKISGASNSLSVALYDNGTGSAWSTRASWADPIASWTSQDASAVTLGNYMGFGLYQAGSGDVTFDDWRGADQ